MRINPIVWVIVGVFTFIPAGCVQNNDDDDDASEKCSASCGTLSDCGRVGDFFSDVADCNDQCTEAALTLDSDEFSKILSCVNTIECDAVEYCMDEELGGEGHFECCQPNDPCDYAEDGACDCGGGFDWDSVDCGDSSSSSADDDDDTTERDPCSECLDSCRGLSGCCTGCGCICESACGGCF